MKLKEKLNKAERKLRVVRQLFKENGIELVTLTEVEGELKDLAWQCASMFGGEPEDFWPRELMESEGLLRE